MKTITSPDDPAMAELCAQLAEKASDLDTAGRWIDEQLELCGNSGVFSWFIPKDAGGMEWSHRDVVNGYLRLSASCLTTTFVLTQRTGACRRIESSKNRALRSELLPSLNTNQLFVSVGISHLTTSRRHLERAVLRAEKSRDGFVLEGFSPWVTGAKHCDYVVTGATLATGEQILVLLPTDLEGVSFPEHARLTGLTSSHTGAMQLERVQIEPRWLLDGPRPNIMASGSGANTGGLETSTLALGVSDAAIGFLEEERQQRNELQDAASALRSDWQEAVDNLRSAADGAPVCSNEALRTAANSLALRSTQAALTAAKGSGYVDGHPVGRWCREALFFLVWSCPAPVARAALCELAAIS